MSESKQPMQTAALKTDPGAPKNIDPISGKVIPSDLEKANNALFYGAFHFALRMFSKVLKDSMDNEDAWIGQLLSVFWAGAYEECIRCADQAEKFIPNSAHRLALKSAALGRVGDFVEARIVAERAFKMPGFGAIGDWARGDFLIDKEAAAAAACFESALQASGKDKAVLLFIAKSYLTDHQFGKALQYLEETVRIDPKNHHVLFCMSLAYKGMQSKESFEKYLRQAISLDANNMEYQEVLRANNLAKK